MMISSLDFVWARGGVQSFQHGVVGGDIMKADNEPPSEPPPATVHTVDITARAQVYIFVPCAAVHQFPRLCALHIL